MGDNYANPLQAFQVFTEVTSQGREASHREYQDSEVTAAVNRHSSTVTLQFYEAGCFRVTCQLRAILIARSQQLKDVSEVEDIRFELLQV